MKVHVWKTSETYLGTGTFLGCVPLLEAYKSIYGEVDEQKLYKKYVENFRRFVEKRGLEVEPEVFELWKEKNKRFFEGSTPKIELSNGSIVYGCQVWWAEDTEKNVEVAKLLGNSFEVDQHYLDLLKEMDKSIEGLERTVGRKKND